MDCFLCDKDLIHERFQGTGSKYSLLIKICGLFLHIFVYVSMMMTLKFSQIAKVTRGLAVRCPIRPAADDDFEI